MPNDILNPAGAEFAQATQENPTENPAPTEGAANPGEQGSTETRSDASTNAAFAAMRVENKNLKVQNDEFLNFIKSQGYASFEDFKSKNAAKITKETNASNEPTESEKKIADLERRLQAFEQANQTSRVQEEARRVISKYHPTEEQWKAILNKATEFGYNLENANLDVEGMYLRFGGAELYANQRAEQARAAFEQGKNAVAAGAPAAITSTGDPGAQKQSLTSILQDMKTALGSK